MSFYAAIIFVDIQTCSIGIRIRQGCVHIFVWVGCLSWDGMALTQRDFLVFCVCQTNSLCAVTYDCNFKVKPTNCVFETKEINLCFGTTVDHWGMLILLFFVRFSLAMKIYILVSLHGWLIPL